jgi:hypothetical protein
MPQMSQGRAKGCAARGLSFASLPISPCVVGNELGDFESRYYSLTRVKRPGVIANVGRVYTCMSCCSFRQTNRQRERERERKRGEKRSLFHLSLVKAARAPASLSLCSFGCCCTALCQKHTRMNKNKKKMEWATQSLNYVASRVNNEHVLYQFLRFHATKKSCLGARAWVRQNVDQNGRRRHRRNLLPVN